MGKLRRGEESAWHTSGAAEVLRALHTDAESGLSNEETARRLVEQGPNELEEKGGRGPWEILWERFTSAMIVTEKAQELLEGSRRMPDGKYEVRVGFGIRPTCHCSAPKSPSLAACHG